MNTILRGKKVAILVADGFEEDELLRPRDALDGSGAKTFVVSPVPGKVRGWKFPPSGGTSQANIPFAFFSQ